MIRPASTLVMSQLRTRTCFPVGGSVPPATLAKLWGSALTGAGLAWGSKLLVGTDHPLLTAGTVLVPYGLTYLAMTMVLGVPEAMSSLTRLRRGRR